VAERPPIRVLHLRDSPWVDGPGRTIVETATRLDASRVEYHVGVFAADPASEHPLAKALKARGVSTHVITDRRGISLEQVRSIVTLMRELRIEVLHTSEFRSNVLALLCRLHHPVRLVTTVHGWIANDLRGKVFRAADKLMLPLFDAVVMVSAATSRLVPRWWLRARKVHVVVNALPPGYGQASTPVVGPTGSAGGATLLNVGRLSAEKGQDLLLRAVAELAPRIPAIRLLFAGIGPEKEALRRLATELGVSERIEFLDFVSDMPALYRGSDVVVQSSLTEGMPNVILEAAALGIPVVATDVGGTAEIVRHGENAHLVRAGSVASLVEGIGTVIGKLGAYRQASATASSGIIARHGIDARARRMEHLYEAIAGRSHGR